MTKVILLYLKKYLEHWDKQYIIWKLVNRAFICAQYYGLNRLCCWVIDCCLSGQRTAECGRVWVSKNHSFLTSERALHAGAIQKRIRGRMRIFLIFKHQWKKKLKKQKKIPLKKFFFSNSKKVHSIVYKSKTMPSDDGHAEQATTRRWQMQVRPLRAGSACVGIEKKEKKDLSVGLKSIIFLKK